MPCTTLLVGKKASNDNSTMIARTDDGFYDVKKMVVVEPSKQPKKYTTKISHLTIEIEGTPVRYTCTPSVDNKNGIWAAQGINAYNVGMSATETITTNMRVQGADPLVVYKKASKKGEKDIPGGIGEEDLVVLVLPYIKTAREGVIRLGQLLEKYGTYEMNGIAFNDENEVWWLETIGGHHWIARRVDDEEYVIMPNQFGLDKFDFEDAYGKQISNMCSKDLKEFVDKYHLDCNNNGKFNPRLAFGSHDDSDHTYNTPRAWFIGRYFNPRTYKWDGENADFNPESDDIPWSLKPERKISVNEVKYILSSFYQGTKYNPFARGCEDTKGKYRPIGINRTGTTSICQIRSDVKDEIKGIQWLGFGGNAFNTFMPVYTNVDSLPKYISNVSLDVDTSNFYWNSRLIGLIVDNNYHNTILINERYIKAVQNESMRLINEFDDKFNKTNDIKVLKEANDEIAKMVKEKTQDFMNKLVLTASTFMKTGYNRSDN